MPTPTTLLVCTDPTLIAAVDGVVDRIGGFQLDVIDDVHQACARIGHPEVLVAIVHLDEVRSVAEVTRLLQTIELTGSRVVTLVISEQHRAEQALWLLRLGVADYLSRPLDLGRLAYLLDVLTVEMRHLGPTADAEPAADAAPAVGAGNAPVEVKGHHLGFLYCPSSPMGRLIDQIERIAPRDTTILLGGETGTGKTRLASVIHQLSPRRDKPFLVINCGALSASLIESEMFGHVKGAFTGADADRIGKFAEVGRGTLFLDEIDSLPLSLQAKLLRAVEERLFEPVGSNQSRPMQARLVVASNRPLDQEVAAGRFRPDLYYRLNVVAFELPPLRERKLVLPALAQAFLEEFSLTSSRPLLGFRDTAMRALLAHDWPGNIRELRNLVERAVALSAGQWVTLADLPPQFQALVLDDAPTAATVQTDASLAETKSLAERDRIAQALDRHGNNRLRAAAELGISRMTLYKKLHKYGLMGA